MLAVIGATSGWYFVRNHNLYGKAFVTSYDARDKPAYEEWRSVPFRDRRPLVFLYGWTTDIYEKPWWPAANGHLLPKLLASTFADFYLYNFAPTHAPRGIDHAPPDEPAVKLSRASIYCGTLIAACAAIAWIALLIAFLRRRRADLVALLLVPAGAVAGQALIGWEFPIDYLGNVKGAYCAFAAPVFFALFGLATEWLWHRQRVFGLVAAASILPVAAYTIYSRLAYFWFK
jgi:hypothetical protein